MSTDRITDKQIAFVKRLADERMGNVPDDVLTSVRLAQAGQMTRGEASELIDAIKESPLAPMSSAGEAKLGLGRR